MLQRKHEDINEARRMAAEFGPKKAERLSRTMWHSIRPPFNAGENGDLVLVFDTVKSLDHSTTAKFKHSWIGPFRLIEKLPNGSYRLEDMNGVAHAGTFAPWRLRIFHQDTNGWWIERSETRPDESSDDGDLSAGSPHQGPPPVNRKDNTVLEKSYTTPKGGTAW